MSKLQFMSKLCCWLSIDKSPYAFTSQHSNDHEAHALLQTISIHSRMQTAVGWVGYN